MRGGQVCLAVVMVVVGGGLQYQILTTPDPLQLYTLSVESVVLVVCHLHSQ